MRLLQKFPILLKTPNIVLWSFLAMFLLLSMQVIPPKRYGDYEYAWMTDSFFNHASPDLRESDFLEHLRLKQKFVLADAGTPLNYPNMIEKGHYYLARNGKFYSHHFWIYSLFCFPVKWLLRLWGGNEFQALQISNSIFLIFAFFHIIFLARWSEIQKFFYVALILFSPVFWFLHWTHKEVFQAAFIVMSLIYLTRREWAGAVLTSAIAAASSSQIIFLPCFFWIKGMIGSKQKMKSFAILSPLLLIAFIPVFFYFQTFGVFHLGFYQEGTLKNMSLQRLLGLFFDLNVGMLPYIPLALLMFFLILGSDAYYQKKLTLNWQLFLVTTLIALACTMKFNYNHGTTGPSRHVVWMLPIVFFGIINSPMLQSRKLLARYLAIAFLSCAVIVQAMTIHWGGWFVPKKSTEANRFSPWAMNVLNEHPAFYNPDYQVFSERANRKESGTIDTPAIYEYLGRCKKALVRETDLDALLDRCDYIPEAEKEFFLDPKNINKLKYVNY
jgi:hypothetical protein